jgi:iron(III) transport system permease protein
MLLLKSFGTTGPDSGSILFFRFFTLPETWNAFFNSFKTAVGVTVFTTLIGGSFAWVVVRTDFPFKKGINIFAIVAFIIPPYITGLAWLQFFGSNGYLERILKTLFALETYNFRYYSISAVIVVMSLHLYPLMYLSLRNALQQQDTDLEKAALLSGASPLKTFTTITTPLMVPSVFATGLLVFSRTMANFTVPALLALPVRKEFITTRIFSSLSALDLSSAAVLSIFLVLISTLLFWTQTFFLPLGRRTVVRQPGTEGMERCITVRLGKKKTVVSGAVFFFLAITTILPILVMFVSSFLKRWGLPLRMEYFTFNNYRQLLSTDGKAFRAFINSVTYGTTAAGLAGIIGGLTAYLSHTAKTKSSQLLEAIASWPMAFPNIVLAVAAIIAWNSRPLRLYGTSWAIIVTYMVLFIPIIMKQVTGLIKNSDQTLIKAARISGASPLRGFFAVTVPSILPGLKSGFLISFLVAMREIPISLMLYSSGQETLGVVLFGMQSEEYGLEMTSALSILIIVLILSVNVVIHTGTKRIKYVKASGKQYIQALWDYKGN